jgi:hypothetical protein
VRAHTHGGAGHRRSRRSCGRDRCSGGAASVTSSPSRRSSSVSALKPPTRAGVEGRALEARTALKPGGSSSSPDRVVASTNVLISGMVCSSNGARRRATRSVRARAPRRGRRDSAPRARRRCRRRRAGPTGRAASDPGAGRAPAPRRPERLRCRLRTGRGSPCRRPVGVAARQPTPRAARELRSGLPIGRVVGPADVALARRLTRSRRWVRRRRIRRSRWMRVAREGGSSRPPALAPDR